MTKLTFLVGLGKWSKIFIPELKSTMGKGGLEKWHTKQFHLKLSNFSDY
jgi:hypothetical protein